MVQESHFCPVCPDQAAGKNLLAVALQVVEFSDTEFFDEGLRQQFAENGAVEGRAPWPGMNYEVRYTVICIYYHVPAM